MIIGDMGGPQAKSVSEGQQQNLPQLENQDDLGQDEFIKILTTQLQHQDPLDPMDDREFIVQMTSFNQLDQLQSLNETQEQSSMLNLLGRHVVAENEDGEIIEGTVTAIRDFNGSPGFEIDGKKVDFEDVVEIKPVDQPGQAESQE
ncbi:flagellar hook capping FlgD N-terminal domain-containing protein [Natranaerobius thermophilus]|uniref:Flagellar hook capping protein n=1 Tax=Natranaerobius thermophilus (strain ATCC BAA-1301 / DSM 18059 / JW/NM-WN-LF) TaxID=457570 RepID=B2A350_NATTJ|nr:flagellar hook capping FlgD N-terminal domain-containing protein [Natranaerobius thermophilus]ACB84981.1 flagellar hook capping protein [Natranaerobius thermophilus JW/NM-WN-LF]